MRPLRYSINITLDGCCHHEAGLPPDEESMGYWTAEMERVDALLFGRVTYEGMRDYWTATTTEPSKITTYMNGLPKIVASRTQTTSNWNNTRMTADIEGEIARQRKESAKDLYIFGSADLTHSLLKAGLVDELMFCYAPLAIGTGNPFFKDKVKVDLIEAKGLSNGGVLVRYRPDNVSEAR